MGLVRRLAVNHFFKKIYFKNVDLRQILKTQVLQLVWDFLLFGCPICIFIYLLQDSVCLMQLATGFLLFAMIGCLLVNLGITVECIFDAQKCLLRNMDWVSGGVFLIVSTVYLLCKYKISVVRYKHIVEIRVCTVLEA